MEYYWVEMHNPKDLGIMRVDDRNNELLIGEGIFHTCGHWERNKGWLDDKYVLGDASESDWNKYEVIELLSHRTK